VNNIQCDKETELEGGCTWIYQKNDSSTNGICVSKITTTYSCENLNRTDQCESGANLNNLIDYCGLYQQDNIDSDSGSGSGSGSDNGEGEGEGDNIVVSCKKHCKELEENDCKNRNYGNDCFWLDKNETAAEEEKCVNKVCVLVLIYFNLC
jgi:hypothetical protein